MKLHGATALVTGTSRGIGHHFGVELLNRGVKVYATARRPETVDIPGAAVRLTKPGAKSLRAAASSPFSMTSLLNRTTAALFAFVIGVTVAKAPAR